MPQISPLSMNTNRMTTNIQLKLTLAAIVVEYFSLYTNYYFVLLAYRAKIKTFTYVFVFLFCMSFEHVDDSIRILVFLYLCIYVCVKLCALSYTRNCRISKMYTHECLCLCRCVYLSIYIYIYAFW